MNDFLNTLMSMPKRVYIMNAQQSHCFVYSEKLFVCKVEIRKILYQM